MTPSTRTLQKYLAESRPYSIDFLEKIRPNDTLDAIVSVTGSEPELTIGTPAIDGTNVVFRLSEGTVGTIHTVAATVTTIDGDTLVGVLAVEILANTQL